MKILSISYLALMLVLTGCGGSSNDRPGVDIFGTWLSPCFFLPASDLIGKTSIRFSEENLSYETTYYNDEDCIEQSLEFETTKSVRTYRLGDKIMTSAGHHAFELDRDITFGDNILFTVKDIVSVINSTLYFGAVVQDEECLEYEQIDFGNEILEICNQRPNELNFEEPHTKKI